MFTLPVIDVKTDLLDALLYGLGLRFEYLTKATDNEAYHHLIQDKEVAIQFISGQDDTVARYYRFVDGHFGQAAGVAKNADLTIRFKDSLTGVKLLTKGDVTAFMTAVQDGDVKVEGDYKLLLWFVGVGKHAATLSEPYQGYVKQAKPYLEAAKPYAKQAGDMIQKLIKKSSH